MPRATRQREVGWARRRERRMAAMVRELARVPRMARRLATTAPTREVAGLNSSSRPSS